MIIPDDPGAFTLHSQQQDLYGNNTGWVVGGHKSDKACLVVIVNQIADLAAAREHFDLARYEKSGNKDYYESGWAFEMHEVPAPAGMSDKEFIQRIESHIAAYRINTSVNPVAYGLWKVNCAAWVNTLMGELGVPEVDRLIFGDFNGLDVGSDVILPGDPFYYQGAPSGTP